MIYLVAQINPTSQKFHEMQKNLLDFKEKTLSEKYSLFFDIYCSRKNNSIFVVEGFYSKLLWQSDHMKSDHTILFNKKTKSFLREKTQLNFFNKGSFKQRLNDGYFNLKSDTKEPIDFIKASKNPKKNLVLFSNLRKKNNFFEISVDSTTPEESYVFLDSL